jgi:DNA polymerase-4
VKHEPKKIIHVDMDAFYAAVEQRDHPSLAGQPIAVGGAGRRGVVMTASYEARRFGVRSAMPSSKARRLCPQLILVQPRFEAYKEASKLIRAIFLEHSTLVEPLSLDEAYLDVSESGKGPVSATLIARQIKEEIASRTGLTASAGVAPNKFLAKAASAMNKPDGLTVVRPDEAEEFIAGLPIERFFGVGPATAKKFAALGVRNGADLRLLRQEELLRVFGKAGVWYYRISRGIDNREVSPRGERKSLSAERTFSEDLSSPEEVGTQIANVASEVARRLAKNHLAGRTVVIKIKYHDFEVMTRSKTLLNEICVEEDIRLVALDLLRHNPPTRPVRLIGVGLTNLRPAGGRGSQLSLDLTSMP